MKGNTHRAKIMAYFIQCFLGLVSYDLNQNTKMNQENICILAIRSQEILVIHYQYSI